MVEEQVAGEGYWREKLGLAVSSLVGLGDIRDRVYGAMLSLMILRPEELRDESTATLLQSIFDRLSVDAAGAEVQGLWKANLGRMSDEEANSISHDILELHNRIRIDQIR